MSKKQINTAIIGASGYTGIELIRILLNHPQVTITNLIADSNAGKNIQDIYPHLRPFTLPPLTKFNSVNWDNIDVAFCCLPHATSQQLIQELPDSIKVIDLSADFRLQDIDTYEKWYDTKHLAPKLQSQAVYGLSEIFSDQIKDARLIACPGCYPTGAILPLFPLLKDKLIDTSNIIIDAKTGITGAGRATKQTYLFTEINEGIKAYNICSHRHMPEITQALNIAANENIDICFTPQLIPMSRGILSTIYVTGSTSEELHNTLNSFYKNKPFIHILPIGQTPSTNDVYATNYCIIGIAKTNQENRSVIVSAIDNLTKGSSGQAVQNMNITFGLEETLGLNFTPIFP